MFNSIEKNEVNQALTHTLGQGQDFSEVTNDQFLAGIFGVNFTAARPLVCEKRGDPDKSGWWVQPWPCNTDRPESNWYCQPSTYNPDSSGEYRAKNQYAEAVYAVMVDDVGTKISKDRFADCPPSWAVETSPNNFQYGYIFVQPIKDLDVPDQLKQRLIQAGLCDSGATGGISRWMRLPVATNGRPRYGDPSPRCRLVAWNPLRYTVDELNEKLGLARPAVSKRMSQENTSNAFSALSQISGDGQVIIDALKSRDLYKKSLGSGKHDITCPWVNQHTDSIDNGAAYFEPSTQFPTGGFKCHHSHGNLYSIHDLKDHLGITANSPHSILNNLPRKLPTALFPVPKLEPDSLPETIRGAAVDLADRLQCPIDYLAVSMLTAAGAVIGNQIGIFPLAVDETWEVYPALWGGIVGDPGSKKSPALQQAHKPLQHLDNISAQTYAQEMQGFQMQVEKYEKELAEWKQKKGAGIKPSLPPEPKRQRYYVHDTTYQALGVILSENPRGVLVIGDELSGLLQSLDTAGQEAARGFYLSGWGGNGNYSFDRIGRGSVALTRYCLSLFGGFQPDRIRGYAQFAQRGNAKNDGLLQRFQLLVWPDAIKDIVFVDRKADKTAMDKYHEAFMQISKLSLTPMKDAISLPNGAQLLHFSQEAQQLFNNWYRLNEKMLARGTLDSARQSHFAKYRSMVPAIALLFHLLDGHQGAVCEDCLTRAVSFAKYLKEHANRVYGSTSGHDYAAVRILAERLLKGQLADGFTCRTLMLMGWSGMSTKEQAQSAIDVLVEYGWLNESEARGAGRPTVKYHLNPASAPNLL